MLGKLKNTVLRITEICGVEVNLFQDGAILFAMCHLRLEKDVVRVVKTLQQVDSLSALVESIPQNVPVALSFCGKGIIAKKVSKSVHEHVDGAINSITLNADKNEFAYDVFETEKDYNICIVRKQKIDSILKQLLDHKVEVISVGLEYIPVLRMMEDLSLSYEEFIVNKYELIFSKGKFSEARLSVKENQILEIGQEKIDAHLVVPYASALNLLLRYDAVINGNFDEILDANSEFFQKRIFKKSLIGALCFVFAILLVNTIVFTNQYSKNERLKQLTSSFSSQSKDIKDEELVVLEKEKHLKENGWLHKSKLSYMSDKLAATVPSSIYLLDMNINPLKIDNASIKKSVFIDGKLNLKGKCYKSSELSNWIHILKNLGWVSDVQMQDYNFDHSTNSAVFNLEITYQIE